MERELCSKLLVVVQRGSGRSYLGHVEPIVCNHFVATEAKVTRSLTFVFIVTEPIEVHLVAGFARATRVVSNSVDAVA